MAFKTFDRKVYFALETNEGTRVAPNAEQGYIETTDPTFSVTNRVYERNPTRMSISPAPAQIPGTGSSSGAASATIEFTFSVELAGSGTIGTAPRWSSLLKACGMNEVAVSSISSDDSLAGGGTVIPKVLRNYENFSSQSGTTYATGTQTGRVIGDHFFDDPTIYYKADGSGSTAPISGDNLVGQISNMYATADSGPTATGGVAWVLTSGTNLGGATGTSSSLTMQVPLNSNGDYVEGVGCRGNVEFAFVSGDRVLMNFTFTGRFNQYAEGGTFTPTAEGRPLPPSFVGVSLGIAESTYVASGTDTAAYTGTIFNSMTIGLNNDLVVRENVSAGSGYDVAYITGRTPSMTFNPDAVRDFSSNPYADLWDRFLSGETTRGRMTVGSAAGNTFLFKFPAAQFTGITDGNRDEVVVWDSTTTLTGGDYGSSVQDRADGANSTVTDARLGTDNEFVFYQL